MQTIKPGQLWKLVAENNEFYGMELRIDKIENGIVRFTDPPFEGFGSGIEYFLKNYVLLEEQQ